MGNKENMIQPIIYIIKSHIINEKNFLNNIQNQFVNPRIRINNYF